MQPAHRHTVSHAVYFHGELFRRGRNCFVGGNAVIFHATDWYVNHVKHGSITMLWSSNRRSFSACNSFNLYFAHIYNVSYVLMM